MKGNRMSATDIRAMTADTIGKDILGALLAEIKLLPKTWEKIPKKKQDDIIDRLRSRVETNVKMAVHLIASEGRTVVSGDLDQITIKDGAKAVIKISRAAESLHELYDAQGKAVLIVVSGAAEHTGGMDEIRGEADQRAMDLGHEYHEDDGGGMDGHEGEVVDAEMLGLPAPDQVEPSEEETSKAYEDGYQAAKSGKAEDDAPNMRYALLSAWVFGWRAWHNENDDEEDQEAA
jgi:ribosome modulation factor